MSITFNCPWCGALCGFNEKHAGKRARCLSCWKLCIIPSQGGEKPQKVIVKEKDEITDGPFSGFYRAVFGDSWKMFIKPQNATAFVFMMTVVFFKFFAQNSNFRFSIYIKATGDYMTIYWPIGYISATLFWGILFWYYMQLIYSTAFGEEVFPDIYIGSVFKFIAKAATAVYKFVVALALVQAPCIIAACILKSASIECDWLLYTLAVAGLFVFPMAILTLAVGQDILMLFRVDHFIKTIIKAPRPYLIVAALTLLTAAAQWKTVAFDRHMLAEGKTAIALCLLGNFAAQALMIFTMRTIGLFYRHYSCYLPW